MLTKKISYSYSYSCLFLDQCFLLPETPMRAPTPKTSQSNPKIDRLRCRCFTLFSPRRWKIGKIRRDNRERKFSLVFAVLEIFGHLEFLGYAVFARCSFALSISAGKSQDWIDFSSQKKENLLINHPEVFSFELHY